MPLVSTVGPIGWLPTAAANATPQASTTAKLIEANSRTVLLIPNSFFYPRSVSISVRIPEVQLRRIPLPRTPVNSVASPPRRCNHHHHARHADRRTKHVPTVRPKSVYDHAPHKRQ